MKTSNALLSLRSVPALLALAVLLPASGPVRAEQFPLFGGQVLGLTKTTIAWGAAFRNANAQGQLVGAGAGQGDNPEFPGASGAVGVNDDANLNFKKGDVVGNALTLTSELSLRHTSGMGVFVRLRAWEEVLLVSKKMSHGSGPTQYAKDTQLDDNNFLGAAKFHGVDIYDAFFFGHYKVAGANVDLRFGRQAIDWGVSVLYPGLNAFNPYDFAWMTTAGATVANGGRLPVNRVYLNVTGSAGWNFDGFYNLEFRPSVMPGCGTWYSTIDNGFHPGCNVASAAGLPDDLSVEVFGTKNYYMGKLYPGGRFPNGGPDALDSSRAPSRWSGYGVSAHKFVEAIGTELGFYYTRYTSPTGIAAPVVGTNPTDFAMNTMFVEGVQAFGLSAATGARNLALFGQFVMTLDQPAQRNAPTFIEGALSGTGPYGWMKSYVNKEAPGHYPLDVAQLQLGGTWQFGEHVHLADATLTAETNLQWATNHPGLDGPNAERLLRYGNFGVADWNQQGYVCSPGPLSNGMVNKCSVDGFVTKFAAGYKLRAQAVVPMTGSGLTFVPVLLFNHDLTGFSADGAILAGRLSLTGILRVLLRQKYIVEGGVTVYDRGAEWDFLRDRGQYTVTFGINL